MQPGTPPNDGAIDPVLFTVTDPDLAARLMRERRWASDASGHYLHITAVLLMAETPGREGPMWSVHGRLEPEARETL